MVVQWSNYTRVCITFRWVQLVIIAKPRVVHGVNNWSDPLWEMWGKKSSHRRSKTKLMNHHLSTDEKKASNYNRYPNYFTGRLTLITLWWLGFGFFRLLCVALARNSEVTMRRRAPRSEVWRNSNWGSRTQLILGLCFGFDSMKRAIQSMSWRFVLNFEPTVSVKPVRRCTVKCAKKA